MSDTLLAQTTQSHTAITGHVQASSLLPMSPQYTRKCNERKELIHQVKKKKQVKGSHIPNLPRPKTFFIICIQVPMSSDPPGDQKMLGSVQHGIWQPCSRAQGFSHHAAARSTLSPCRKLSPREPRKQDSREWRYMLRMSKTPCDSSTRHSALGLWNPREFQSEEWRQCPGDPTALSTADKAAATGACFGVQSRRESVTHKKCGPTCLSPPSLRHMKGRHSPLRIQ